MQRKLHPTEIISHRLSLDEGVTGHPFFMEHKENVLKVVLTPQTLLSRQLYP
ncbi:MAG: hypothetical protein IIB89_06905 [Chloroflexi bacterium]|nr:hypothetical protein [Chloroflexota bacterium]